MGAEVAKRPAAAEGFRAAPDRAGSGRYKTLIKGAAKAHRFANISRAIICFASSAAGVLMLLKATMVFTPRAVPPAPSPAPAAH